MLADGGVPVAMTGGNVVPGFRGDNAHSIASQIIDHRASEMLEWMMP